MRKNSIKRYCRQIIAIVEKNFYLDTRVKARVIMRFLDPIIQLLIFIFLYGFIFNTNTGFQVGYWNKNNYVLFLLLAFCVQFSKSITQKYNSLFIEEKYWKTLSAMMVAPLNRFTLLFGVLISELVMLSIPLSILFIVMYILYPIPLLFLILTLLVFFSICLIFAAIGLIVGVLAMSNEKIVPYTSLILRFTFLFACIGYPREIFPEIFQILMFINPLYYIIDLLRLSWYLGIDYEVAILLITPIHIILLILMTILIPLISLYFFEYIYKKYGIQGY